MNNENQTVLYIIVNSPSQYPHYNWTINDSVDGVLYTSAKIAADVMKATGVGVGVQELFFNNPVYSIQKEG